MDDLIKVCLIGPAKVGGRWLKQGNESVSAEEKLALEEAGMLVAEGVVTTADQPGQRFFTEVEWEAAVQSAALLIAGQAFGGELGKMEAELKEIVELTEKEKAELLSRLGETGQLLTAERQKSADLAEKLTAADAVIAALKAAQPETQAQTDTPPSEKVAKTALKKAAATDPKG